MDLLREYGLRNSEPAFETLVNRHIGLVYSVALRQVENPAHAEEITQAVFLILARKAGRLHANTVLAGWLHETARFAAASFLRGEQRRRHREQEAYMQSNLPESEPDKTWEKLAPFLDDAIGHLGKADRDAIVLRFFQNKSAREIAAVLNVHESAAQKRLNRAVEKLRAYFLERGVTVSGSTLAGTIPASFLQHAPVHLAASVSAAAAHGAVINHSTYTLIKGALKLMAWTKAKIAVVMVATAIVTGGITTIIIKTHASSSAGQNSGTMAKLEKSPRIFTGGINKTLSIPGAIYTYPDGDETTHHYLEFILKRFRKDLDPARNIKSDRELSDVDLQTKTICIYGSPENHRLFQQVRDQLPIVFANDGIVVGKKKYLGRDVGAIFVCPNPINPEHRLVIYGTVSPEALKDMNGVFHGPTDYIIFNNTTRQFGQVQDSDRFLLLGAFDKSDSTHWRVAEDLELLPPKILQRATSDVTVAQ